MPFFPSQAPSHGAFFVYATAAAPQPNSEKGRTLGKGPPSQASRGHVPARQAEATARVPHLKIRLRGQIKRPILPKRQSQRPHQGDRPG